MKAIAAELQSFPPAYADPSATSPRIAGLALAHPDTSYTQEQVLERLGLADDEFARRIFGRCGVQRRRLRLDDEFLGATVQARTPAIEQMLLDEATRAVDELAIDPAEIGVVVTSSLYTLAGPTLAHRLVEHYAMDPATDKYHVVGVGCASAVPLLRLAGQALAGAVGGVGGSQTKALVVAAESMSGIVSRARGDDERSKTVGSSIFGDGCAAALIELGEGRLREDGGDLGDGSDVDDGRGGGATDAVLSGATDAVLSGATDAGLSGPTDAGLSGPTDAGLSGPTVLASKVHQVAGTLDAVRMQLKSDDSYLHLIRELPDVAAEGLGELADEFLAANGLGREDVDRWLLHPGGRRIIESLQGALGLSREQAQSSFDVLAEHGNIGTPAIFYVLKRSLEQRAPAPGEHAMMVTVGPGVTVGLMLLRW